MLCDSSRRFSAGGGLDGGGMDIPWPPCRAPNGGYCPGDPVNAAHALPYHTMVVAAPVAPSGMCFTFVILCSILLALRLTYETLVVIE